MKEQASKRSTREVPAFAVRRDQRTIVFTGLPPGVDAFAFKLNRQRTVVVSDELTPPRTRTVMGLLARGRRAFDVVMTPGASAL